MKAFGLTKKSNRSNPIIGFTDSETAMLDFDGISFKNVKYWALKVMKRFKLGGCLILKSSEKCYHVIFNRPVSWRKNMGIVAWVCLRFKRWSLTKWFLLQCIKCESTLRVSPKGEKSSPRIVFRFGREDEQIKEYLSRRRMVKRFLREMLYA